MRRARTNLQLGSRQGMTLLEVLVAMTVLAIGIVGVLGAVSASLRSSTASAQYSVATLLAGRVAAELERLEALEPGELNGAFEETARDYAWTAEIASADEFGLHPVRITINWDAGTKHFYLYTQLRPHSPPPAKASDSGSFGDTSGAESLPADSSSARTTVRDARGVGQ